MRFADEMSAPGTLLPFPALPKPRGLPERTEPWRAGGYEKLAQSARDMIAQELVRKVARSFDQGCCQECGIACECGAGVVREGS